MTKSMKPETITLLNRVNLDFYQRLAPSFSATRQRVQNGVMRMADAMPDVVNVLDVGCGNGNFSVELVKLGKKGHYLGIDFSAPLLAESEDVGEDGLQVDFECVDVLQDGWDAGFASGSFAQVTSFAVFHHIPGAANRLRIYQGINRLLPVGHLFIHSNWQFLNSPRLAERVQSWDVIGLDAADVEENDYLLDWRRDGSAFRFVHHYDVDELKAMAPMAGFAVQEVFFSDGQGGNLGMYQIWKKVAEVAD